MKWLATPMQMDELSGDGSAELLDDGSVETTFDGFREMAGSVGRRRDGMLRRWRFSRPSFASEKQATNPN
jgi:hypothetical protein